MGEMGGDEDPGEADAHLDATEQGPQSSRQVPVKIQARMSRFILKEAALRISRSFSSNITINTVSVCSLLTA